MNDQITKLATVQARKDSNSSGTSKLIWAFCMDKKPAAEQHSTAHAITHTLFVKIKWKCIHIQDGAGQKLVLLLVKTWCCCWSKAGAAADQKLVLLLNMTSKRLLPASLHFSSSDDRSTSNVHSEGSNITHHSTH